MINNVKNVEIRDVDRTSNIAKNIESNENIIHEVSPRGEVTTAMKSPESNEKSMKFQEALAANVSNFEVMDESSKR